VLSVVFNHRLIIDLKITQKLIIISNHFVFFDEMSSLLMHFRIQCVVKKSFFGFCLQIIKRFHKSFVSLIYFLLNVKNY